jgi:S1-C subfamily serine protease
VPLLPVAARCTHLSASGSQIAASVPGVRTRASRSWGSLLFLLATAIPLQATATTPEEGAIPTSTPTPTPCEPGWISRVYKDARPSIVRIENARGIGTGFLVFSQRYVATALHVVAGGRTLTLTAIDGSRQGATVVVTDELDDLALLELERPIDAPPLAASTLSAPVGTPVLVIGHPLSPFDRSNHILEGLLDWTATEGIVSERNSELLQTDAAVNPGNSGGPMLACDGRVLALVTSKVGGEGIGFAVPMSRVSAMQHQIGKQPAYLGGWSAEGQLDLQAQFDRQYLWFGFGVGASVVGHDRWATGIRGSLLWGSSDPGTSQVLSSNAFRGLGEIDETYRVLVQQRPFPVYTLFGLGVAGSMDRLTQTTLAEAAATGCAPQGSFACTTVVGVHTVRTNFMAWPTATFGFLLGGVELTYEFQANVTSLADSEHRLLLGLRF